MSDLTLADLPALALICSALAVGLLGYIYPDLTVRSVRWPPVLAFAAPIVLQGLVFGSRTVVAFGCCVVFAAGAVALVLLAIEFIREDENHV